MTLKSNVWKAIAVLVIGLLLTLSATIYTHWNVEKLAKKDFSDNCDDIKTAIASRMQAHAQILRTASAFMESSDTITRLNWKIFSEQSNLDKELPGIQEIGYSIIIPENQLKQHIEKIRKEGFPDYAVKPVNHRFFYTAVLFLEPFTGRNLSTFGYDMFSEPIRRKAMEAARDSDIAVLSGKVTLAQETDTNFQCGTLMYLPVFRNSLPTLTIAQRRTAIKGWVYCTYRMNDLMRDVLGKWDLGKANRIHLQIFDETISVNSLLYDSQITEGTIHQDTFGRSVSLPVEFGYKKWILNFSMNEDDATFFEGKILLVLISGLIISSLIFFLTLSLLNTRNKAQKIAVELTKEIKESAEVLEQSEMKFRTIFNNIRDIYLRADPNGIITEISPSVKKILLYDRLELIGKPVEKLFYNHEDRRTLISEVSEKEEILGYEVQLKNKNNEFVWVSANIHKVYDHQGKFTGLEGNARDIRERKIAENALKQSEERYRNLVENITDVIFEFDSEGFVTYISPSVEKISGYQPEEIIGNKISHFIRNYDDVMIKRFDELATAPEMKDEYEGITKSGVLRHVLTSTKANFDKGIFKGGSGTLVDITDRKLREIQLGENESLLRELNATKDKFFSIIAHDLRTPFTGLLGYTQLMTDDFLSCDEIKEYSKDLDKLVRQTFDFLEELLEWARMERGLMDFNPKPTILIDAVTKSLGVLSEMAHNKSIELIIDVPEELEVFVDYHMILTVIRNLTSNAVKFTPHFGKVTLSTEKIGADKVLISVKDTGIGMNEEMRNNLFNMDVYTKRSGTDGEHSSGLGLLLCKEFVVKNGGILEVDSEVGKGSTFRFTVPINPD